MHMRAGKEETGTGSEKIRGQDSADAERRQEEGGTGSGNHTQAMGKRIQGKARDGKDPARMWWGQGLECVHVWACAIGIILAKS